MEYTIEDIRKALIPVIGDGEATQKILKSFKKDTNDNSKAIQKNHIVADQHGVLYRVIHINDHGHYKCKGWDGHSTIDYSPAEIRLATQKERAKYYKNQVEFLRTGIAPFLNFFSMRQLAEQIKDEPAKESMNKQLKDIAHDCFIKLQDIKKLW